MNDNNKYKVIDGKYECPKIPLDEEKSKYIYIPKSVITDTELGKNRVGVFAYLRLHYGLNNVIGFTVPDMVEWCNEKSSRKIGGKNEKYLDIVDALSDRGYLTYLTEQSRSSYMKCKFDTKYYGEECSDGYACLYIDEIKKITNYPKEHPEDTRVSSNVLLLVFAYLRNKIKRRPNELKPEERYPERVKERRERMPEAYNKTYTEIADELGLSKRHVSMAVNILNKDLQLIVLGEPKHILIDGVEYRTPDMIFANFEKREHTSLLAFGEEYASAEIEQQAYNISKKGYYPYRLKRVG